MTDFKLKELLDKRKYIWPLRSFSSYLNNLLFKFIFICNLCLLSIKLIIIHYGNLCLFPQLHLVNPRNPFPLSLKLSLIYRLKSSCLYIFWKWKLFKRISITSGFNQIKQEKQSNPNSNQEYTVWHLNQSIRLKASKKYQSIKHTTKFNIAHQQFPVQKLLKLGLDVRNHSDYLGSDLLLSLHKSRFLPFLRDL